MNTAQDLYSADAGCITAVPAANDNVPFELRKLGLAIGTIQDDSNLPPIVAFTGLAGTGKSTATRYLVAQHGYTLVKFAGPLKDMMRAIGLSEDQIEGALKETSTRLLQGKTPRHAMQTLGTEWGRDQVGKNFWVDLWAHRVLQVLDSDGRVVVDDCRFANEAKAIRGLGGDIYRLIGRGGIAGNHKSERGCGDEDLVIANIWDEASLFRKVEDAIRKDSPGGPDLNRQPSGV